MKHCPVCRALLNGADVCRRCRADLGNVRQIEQRSAALEGAALHFLALGDAGKTVRLLRRARAIHATPETAWILRRIEALRESIAQPNEPHTQDQLPNLG